MTTTEQTALTGLPMLLEEVEVVRVERLSPSFVRVELGSPALADFGVDGPLYDQRIKLIFPGAHGLPSFDRSTEEAAMASWYERPEEERGYMRTYSVRDVLGEGEDTRLVVDFVIHGPDDPSGPGGEWGAHAEVGQRLVAMVPRKGLPFGGIEFDPAGATRLLLVGDETAVPAIARILEDLPAEAKGSVFVEVPLAEDIQDLRTLPGISITWLPRNGRPRGSEIHGAVLELLGADVAEPVIDEVDPDLWETPTYSSSGEEVDVPVRTVGHEYDGLYAWIAGEAKVVTGLRRALVRDRGIDRHQVCFMGYWRVGVAMRS
ncbi:MAG: siderophore-interacting protein [Actinomycetota bacterium]|nr:siderophore-interacting protein [Actinomycetota bacterium]